MRSPSWKMSVAPAGMLPGTAPPTSAWWARFAANPTRSSPSKMGATSVQSGRWVPPANGSFTSTWSPGPSAPGNVSIAAATDAGIEPRWTGMCSAWATIRPSGSNSAVEQSTRSLMFGE